MGMLAVKFAQIAEWHRRHTETATTDHERAHWQSEVSRFDQLAANAKTAPDAARRAYRPTRAYNPTTPIVCDLGDTITITTAAQGAGQFDRDRLETAYLLWLMAPASTPRFDVACAVRATLADEHGLTGPGEAVRYTLAVDALIRNGINL